MVAWNDSNIVNVISSIGDPQNMSLCKRRGKDADGRDISVEVPRPQVVDLYNAYMGGVDHCDQLRATYPLEDIFRTQRWYKKLYLGLFGIALTNAYILWTASANSKDEAGNHELFMLDIQMYLIHSVEPEEVEPGVEDEVDHEPVFYKDEEGNKHEWVNMNMQPRCKVCSMRVRSLGGARTSARTWFFCKGCDGTPSLCHPNTGRDCWKLWHTPRRIDKLRREVGASRKRGRDQYI